MIHCSEFWQMHNSHLWRCRMFLSFQKVHSCPFPHTEYYSCFFPPHISSICSEILHKWHYTIHISLHPSSFSSSVFLYVISNLFFFCCRMIFHYMKLCILKILSPIDGHLGCFWFFGFFFFFFFFGFWLLLNKNAIDILIQGLGGGIL